MFLIFDAARGPIASRVEAARAFDGDRWVGWLLPAPSTWRALAPEVVRTAHSIGAKGIVVNPERAWLGHAAEAAEFSGWLAEQGLGVVVSSYAMPPATFPLAEFYRRGFYGNPLTFDRDHALETSYLRRSLERWRALGWAGELVASAGLWNHRANRAKSPDEARAHLRQRPKASIVWGAGVWSRDLCRVVSEWQAGRRDPGGEPPESAAAAGFSALLGALAFLFLGPRGR